NRRSQKQKKNKKNKETKNIKTYYNNKHNSTYTLFPGAELKFQLRRVPVLLPDMEKGGVSHLMSRSLARCLPTGPPLRNLLLISHLLLLPLPLRSPNVGGSRESSLKMTSRAG